MKNLYIVLHDKAIQWVDAVIILFVQRAFSIAGSEEINAVHMLLLIIGSESPFQQTVAFNNP